MLRQAQHRRSSGRTVIFFPFVVSLSNHERTAIPMLASYSLPNEPLLSNRHASWLPSFCDSNALCAFPFPMLPYALRTVLKTPMLRAGVMRCNRQFRLADACQRELPGYPCDPYSRNHHCISGCRPRMTFSIFPCPSMLRQAQHRRSSGRTEIILFARFQTHPKPHRNPPATTHPPSQTPSAQTHNGFQS